MELRIAAFARALGTNLVEDSCCCTYSHSGDARGWGAGALNRHASGAGSIWNLSTCPAVAGWNQRTAYRSPDGCDSGTRAMPSAATRQSDGSTSDGGGGGVLVLSGGVVAPEQVDGRARAGVRRGRAR